MMSLQLHHTRTLLHDLEQAVGHLLEALLPGTARTWRPPVQVQDRRSDDQKAEARAERLERVAIAPGENPAPLDLGVLDLLTDLLVDLDDLADQCATAAWRPVDPPAQSSLEDPRRFVRLVAHLLPELDTRTHAHVLATCRPLLERAHTALGMVTDGQLLAGLCPVCHGTTPTSPLGGTRTLRVRQPYAGARVLIVCEGDPCEPTSAQCGPRWRGMPAWDLLTEGEWLAAWIGMGETA